ncbi:allantoate amidohydrolase [Nocardioides marinus]|uniref:N-carbamoyl-L-amino-acid hydrolase n=1 Tax=Nocardioides marinus TaxID=374514 RepID=A0A7Y9YHH6_9ACTN|nr:allantoate amidohydrolase [Nocardioides marinus]NYI11774.1 N-carbamoyl-L-amino-acid hydrolase [Nocardioides marinus]
MPADFEAMWREIAPVGRNVATGGYLRQPWTSPEAELRAWFVEQCEARGLCVERDGLGNLVGWWDVDAEVEQGGAPATTGRRDHPTRRRSDAVLTGSHLDSVLEGGAYDGPLGVVSALAAIDRMREHAVVPRRPVGVGVFVEEEGSRFGLACLGSRLLTGATPWATARELRDRDGVFLADALEAQGLPGMAPDHVDLLAGVTTFVELHVEQGRALVDLGHAVGVASGIWPHGRYRFDIEGVADHAGTTRMEDRRDPMLTYAQTVLAANEAARLAGERATFGRVEVNPNGTNAVPSRVTGWLDARASSVASLEALVERVSARARERAEGDGTTLTVTAESVSGEVSFDPDLAASLAAGHAGGDWPVLPTQAGHDAGILSAAGIPTAMLFVRNPTGVSHSPDEHAEVPDCLAGVDALAETLTRLVS